MRAPSASWSTRCRTSPCTSWGRWPGASAAWAPPCSAGALRADVNSLQSGGSSGTPTRKARPKSGRLAMKMPKAILLAAVLSLGATEAPAADKLKVAFAQRGLEIETLYTQGGPEAHQAVISGSMDVACGGGIESAIGAFARGAPLHIVGSVMIGSPDTYWFVPANSPIRSLNDASGKTISFSQNGSSSHTALLALLEQYKVDAKPVATGGHPQTLTMAMTGQIDIGRGAAPNGLELV